MLRRYFFESRLLGVCIIGCVLIMVSCVLSCDINAHVFVMMNTYYEGDKFWSQSGIDMGSCAKICMRLTKCKSFNFDITKRDCNMNSDLLEDNPHLGKSKKRSVYSRIKDWPNQLDPVCFHRPCKKDEVCIPSEAVNVEMGSEQCIVVRGTKTDLPDRSPTATEDHDTAARESASSAQGLCYKASSWMTTMADSKKWKSAAPSPTAQDPTAASTSTLKTPEGCDLPEDPQDGNVTIYEGKANYSCDPCFTLQGETTRTCLPDGQWEGVAPTCTVEHYTSGKRNYFFVRCEKRWRHATSDCISRGGHLVDIESEEENDFLCDKLVLESEGTHIWLDGQFTGRAYAWNTTGVLMNETGYSNWAKTGPSEYRIGKCVIMVKTAKSGCVWVDRRCHESHFFICEQVSDTE